MTSIMTSLLATPGHFSLPLSCNRKTADTKRLRYKQDVLLCLLRAKKLRPERHAIRNLLGLLAARMEQYDEAMGHFIKITSEEQDACNLNAFANMKHICEFQYRFREAESYENKLRQYANLATSEDGGEILSMQCESRKVHARCMAEQGFAVAFDLDDMPHKYQGHRYRKAYDLFRTALRVGKDDVSDDEMQEWKYNLGIICFNIGIALKDTREGEWEMYLKESLSCLSETCMVNDENMAAESWCYIAKVLDVCKYNDSMLEWIKSHKELASFPGNTEECIYNAKQIKPDKASVYVHHAEMIKESQERSLEAVQLIDKAIDLDNKSVLRRKAYSLRGEIQRKMYLAQIHTFREYIFYKSDDDDFEQRPLEPDRDILHKAKDDFETATSIAVNSFDLAALGEIWHLLAKDLLGEVFSTSDQEEQVQHNLNKALMYFTQATHCMDGALDATVNHMRGLCLLDSEEKEAALESFKLAIECQPVGHKNIDHFACLMEVYLSLICDNLGDQRYQTRLLSEMVYWSEIAITGYGPSDVRDYILHTDQWSDMPEAVDVFLKFCESTDHPKVHMVFSAAKSRTVRPKIERRLSLKVSPSRNATTNKPPPAPASAPAKVTGRPSFNILAADKSECETTPRRPNKSELQSSNQENRNNNVSHTNAPSGDASNLANIPSNSEQDVVLSNDLKTDEIPEAPEHARFEGYVNDFFVIYSPSSSDWVHYNLLPKLERTQGLKGCTKDRDFIAGRYVVQNYTRCIDKSAVVLLIITKDFESRSDCQSFMSHALTPEEGKDIRPVIPIVRDDCKIPSVLRNITPFHAMGVLNWNKLGDAIEYLVKTPEES